MRTTILGEPVHLPPAAQVSDGWASFVGRLQEFIDMLPVLGIALAIVLAFGALSSLLRRWDGLFRFVSRNQLLRSVIRNLVATLVLLVGVLLALEILDATKFVGALLGAAGVVGLALGFAFKDIVENYLASVLLAVRRPFRIRDAVDIDGHVGKVMALNTRATVLMTFEGNHVRLPNAMVFKAVITNFTRNPMRRFSFTVGAGTSVELTAAQALGLATLAAMEAVADEPAPFSVITELGDSTVAIEFRGWVDQAQFNFEKVRGEAMRRVKVAFDEASIEMPEPTYRVLMPRADGGEPPAPAKPAPTEAAPDLRADDDIDRQMDRDDASELGSNLLHG